MYKKLHQEVLNTVGLLSDSGAPLPDGKTKYVDEENPSGPIQFSDSEKLLDFFGIEGNSDCRELLKGRALRLNSSALLAFLIFYDIKGSTLKLPLLKDIIGKEEITVSKVVFESPNKVFTKPSMVDVALYSEDDNVIIYLESKFTEYLKGCNSGEKSDSYRCAFNKIFGGYEKEKLVITADLFPKQKLRYGDGISQMIAHVIGVNNGPSSGSKLKDEIENNKPKVILGEIIYKFSNFDKNNSFEDYNECYKEFIKKVDGKFDSKDNIHYLPNLITYQDVLLNNPGLLVNENVKRFYNL